MRTVDGRAYSIFSEKYLCVGCLMKTGFFLIACLLGFLIVSSASSTPRFQEICHKVEGEIQEARAEDLDLDGIKEMIVSLNIHGEEKTDRYLRVFQCFGKKGDPGISQRREWKVIPEAVFWGVGSNGEKEKKQACYFLAWNGMWELCEAEGNRFVPRHRIEAPVFVTYGQEDQFLSLEFIRDWDGDGLEEVFLPLVQEARFYKPHGNGTWKGFDHVKVVPFPIYNNNILFGRNMGGYQYLSFSFFPLLVPADLNGDGRMDLLTLKSGTAHCFYRGEDGRLDPKPVVWNLDIRTREERIRKQATLSFRVADLNRDGCADIVVHKIGVKFTDWNAETAIFLGKPDGQETTEPYQRFSSGGLLSGVSLEDLDGNGYPDLTLWSIKMGLWPFIEILLRKVIHLESQYYYADWPGGFPSKPAEQLGHDFRIDLKRQDFFQGLIPNTTGDFNGDGVKDLVAGKGYDTIAIYPGKPKEGFSSRPMVTLKTPGVNYVSAEDLNGDGRCDLSGFRVEDNHSELCLWIQNP